MSDIRDEIMAISIPLPREEIDIPAWRRKIYVRGLTARERDRLESMLDQSKRDNFRGMLAAFTICDEGNRRVFGDADANWLGNQPAMIIDPIVAVALRLSRFTMADVEQLEKKFGEAITNGSSCDSQPITASRSRRSRTGCPPRK